MRLSHRLWILMLSLSMPLVALAADASTAQNIAANRVIFVSPNGDDAAAGTREAPRKSVQKALNQTGPGEIVRLLPGVFRERVSFKQSGEFSRPIVLEGTPGAILDGSEDFVPQWQPADDIAPGVFRASVPFKPRTILVDGKFLTMLNEPRVSGKKVTDPQWEWREVFRNGVRGRWSGVRGLGLYLSNRKELIVRFENNLDPRGMMFSLAPESAVVHIDGVNRCVVRNLEIRAALYGVRIERSLGSVVEFCRFNPTDHGIWLDEGADRCTIRFNEITQNPLSIYVADSPEEGKLAWDTWQAVKRAGFWDSMGIQIERTLGGHEIHDNHIYNHWDGIQDIHWNHFPLDPAKDRIALCRFNQNMNIHHNRIERTNDDALEPNGGEVNAQWHDNLVIKTRCALRIKNVDMGPLYIYRNYFIDNAEDIRIFGDTDLNPAQVFVYHNSSTSEYAVVSNKVFGIGTPNYHFYNNLFWPQGWWHNSGKSVQPNWISDYNVFVRRGESAQWDEGKTLSSQIGIDANSHWIDSASAPYADAAKHDLSLSKDSPARGAGADLAKILGRTLPGLESSSTSNPDAGALGYGQPMPTIPRDPKTVQMSAAGCWPEPDK